MQRRDDRTNWRQIANRQQPSRWAAIWTDAWSPQQGETRSRSAIADKALEFGRFRVLLPQGKQSWRQ
jgi:hypothetical protein